MIAVSRLIVEARGMLPGAWAVSHTPDGAGRVRLTLTRFTTLEGCDEPIGIVLSARAAKVGEAAELVRGLLAGAMVEILNTPTRHPLTLFSRHRLFQPFGPFCQGHLTCPTAEDGCCACSAMLHAIAADLVSAAHTPSSDLDCT